MLDILFVLADVHNIFHKTHDIVHEHKQKLINTTTKITLQ